MSTTSEQAIRLIRMPELKSTTGLSKSAIYDRMKEGTFPKSVSLGGQSVAWVASEVQDWVKGAISERDRTLGSGRNLDSIGGR